MIEVTSHWPSESVPSTITVDAYIPMKLSLEPRVVPRYIFLRSSNGIVELKVPEENLRLIAFIVVHFDSIPHKRRFGNGPVDHGLPVLQLPTGLVLANRDLAQIEIPTDQITFDLLDEFAEVGIGENAQYDSSIRHGRLEFLVGQRRLTGARLYDLTAEERLAITWKLSQSF